MALGNQPRHTRGTTEHTIPYESGCQLKQLHEQTRKLQTEPPLHNVNGARYHNGAVYLATNGGPTRGIYSINPTTAIVTPVVNNYRGRHLNSPNDLVFDSKGSIWFTDPPYGWSNALSGVQPPELPTAVYTFNPTSKALVAVSNSVVQMPNGLFFSPDESVLYVADSNTSAGRPLVHSPAAVRNVWAFDVRGSSLTNPRLVYQCESGWPDGLQVTKNGLLLVAALGGVDVVDPTTGVLLGKVNTPGDIVFNLERGPIREGRQMWLLTGRDYVYKLLMKID